jgi:hypothetical protein
MSKGTVKAKLKFSRKRGAQRRFKPLAKHGSETWSPPGGVCKTCGTMPCVHFSVAY